MRWFWLFILGLVLVTGGLYAMRVRTKPVVAPAAIPLARPPIAAVDVPQEADEPEVSEPTVVVEPVPEAEPEVPVQREVHADVGVEEAEEEAEVVVEPVIVEEVAQEVVEPIEEVVDEEPRVVAVEEEVVQEEQVQESKPVPTFEQLASGAIHIFATDTVVTGTGTQSDPFVLDWVTLRAIERVFNPKKGKDELPGWLDVLNGKYVKIKGNTLVPVIATTTRELLVMQNPWDGCCIGIPPSPYDAIEVELDHDVDFGSSAVGYGTVEGVFILDPYVVDGWVLGLYMIEDASYRSGEGVPFPDF